MTIPRINIAHLPTKIEPLPRISALLGGPTIFCKRDDQTGLGFGGNKTRKLEFLLADARKNDAKTLITVGAIQSNHCRQTAALAARYGFDCTLVLSGAEPEIAAGNLFLDTLFGATIIWSTRENREQILDKVFKEILEKGGKPYKIPYGASNALGMLGYFEAMIEMNEQVSDIDWIIVASSSGGTQAGMLLGAREINFHGRIMGISIDNSAAELAAIIERLTIEGALLKGFNKAVNLGEIVINDQYLGEGYGVMGKPEIETIRMFAEYEGLLLDPVYTGRAAAGMIDLIKKRFFKPEEKILFWHTGGTPALFTEPYLSMLQSS